MIIPTLALVTNPFLAPSINDFIPTNFKDLSFTWKMGTANFAELQKINKDFAQSYRFKTSSVRIKEPFKLRIESTVEDTTITYVINGTDKLIRIPRSKLNLKQKLAKDPGKLQTTLDFGIITPALLNDFYTATFVREDRGTQDVVFDLNYVARFKDKTRQRVWIDPKQKYISKREWYNRDGRLMATFSYANPVQESGVWFASQITVRNADNKVAGTSSFERIKFNEGLAESLFEIK